MSFNMRSSPLPALMLVAACAAASPNPSAVEPAEVISQSAAAEDKSTEILLDGSVADEDTSTEPSHEQSESSTSLPTFASEYASARLESTTIPYTSLPSWFIDFDPLSWYAAVEQTPPKKRRAMRRTLSAPPFPGFSVARIRAFDLGYGEYADALEDKCDAVTDRGTLCPQVIAPGKTLSDEQQARLMAIVKNPPEFQKFGSYRRGRPRFRCFDEPATVFIFYDSNDNPGGIVTLTVGCLSWQFQPAVFGTWEDFEGLFEEERPVIHSLCDELEMRGCGTHPPKHPPRQEPIIRARRLLPGVLEPPPSIDEAKPLSDTTSAERLTLCVWAWRGIQTASIALRSKQETAAPGFVFTERGNSSALEMLSIDQCLRRFPAECRNNTSKEIEGLRTLISALAEGRVVIPPTCLFGIAPLSSDPADPAR